MRVIDSHTEGEPTRLIISGGPDLGRGSMAERKEIFAKEFDHLRSFCVNEPRGHDAIVGALLCEPVDSTCAAGVIFFNNVGMLGMCGHGTIGLAATLAHMGRMSIGSHRIETPIGIVAVKLNSPNEAEIANVPSYRHKKQVSLQVPSLGLVTGDIAWGGNWFFLCQEAPCAIGLNHLQILTHAAQAISDALWAQGICGEDGARIDHIEFFGSGVAADADSRNFVLCPGGAYDRSPCGTGTSAKLACLAADGKLAVGDLWRQESITGSVFVGSYVPAYDESSQQAKIRPSIRGTAFVNMRGELLLHEHDPLQWGIRSA